MSIGKRIRFFRNLRGMTQQQLGIVLGFTEQTAHVRIAQYEMGKKEPRMETLEEIAKALNVSPAALKSPNLDCDTGCFHTLFQLEDEFAIQISSIDGRPCMIVNPEKINYILSLKAMTEWKEQYECYCRSEITREEYDQWRYTHE